MWNPAGGQKKYFIFFCKSNLRLDLHKQPKVAVNKRKHVTGGTPPVKQVVYHNMLQVVYLQHISTTCGGRPQVVVLPLRIPMQLSAALV